MQYSHKNQINKTYFVFNGRIPSPSYTTWKRLSYKMIAKVSVLHSIQQQIIHVTNHTFRYFRKFIWKIYVQKRSSQINFIEMMEKCPQFPIPQYHADWSSMLYWKGEVFQCDLEFKWVNLIWMVKNVQHTIWNKRSFLQELRPAEAIVKEMNFHLRYLDFTFHFFLLERVKTKIYFD